jgi:hypothetical protein
VLHPSMMVVWLTTVYQMALVLKEGWEGVMVEYVLMEDIRAEVEAVLHLLVGMQVVYLLATGVCVLL